MSRLRDRQAGAVVCRCCFDRAKRFRRLADQTPDALNEAMGAFDAGLGPDDVAIGRRIGKHEEARGIGAVGGDDIVRVDDVLLRLRHLLD
ncbi:hypothetical protein D3C71_2068200 [compost metagenome]